jgi:hypothetical protein
MDGTLIQAGDLSAVETTGADETSVSPGANGCDRFGITWFPERDDLLISWYPHCG